MENYVLKQIIARADAGDLEAMLELGKKFANGDGVKRNEAKAEKYLVKAAQSGNVAAQIELGKFYTVSLKYSSVKALDWFEKAVSI